MKHIGKVWKFGNYVNTDVIYPGRYLSIIDEKMMAKHAMEDLEPEFAKNVQKGDIIVAGKYFGCGSSREQAVICLKACGIATIVAETFARIFYRNAINLGLPIITCPGISLKVSAGHNLEIDFELGAINNLSTGEAIGGKPLPSFVMGIIKDGGLIPHLKKIRRRL